MKYTKKSKIVWVAFLIIPLLLLTASNAFSTTVGEITQALTCTCGCNMVVSACEGAMECSAAKQITDKVVKRLARGQSKDEIIKYFIGFYGERILAAPTKQGFNLSAWILPFLAIVLGGAGIYIFLYKCLTSKKIATDESKLFDVNQTPDGKYIDQLEKELADFTP